MDNSKQEIYDKTKNTSSANAGMAGHGTARGRNFLSPTTHLWGQVTFFHGASGTPYLMQCSMIYNESYLQQRLDLDSRFCRSAIIKNWKLCKPSTLPLHGTCPFLWVIPEPQSSSHPHIKSELNLFACLTTIYKHYRHTHCPYWLTELRFYVPLDRKWVIL